MASSFNLKSWIGRFLQQPHNYFILAALNVLVLQLSFWSGSLMIVTSIAIFLTGTRLIYFIAFCLFLCWGVYKLLNRFLINRYLSWVHAMITILVVFIFIVTHIWVPKSSASDGFQADMMGHVCGAEEPICGFDLCVGNSTLFCSAIIPDQFDIGLATSILSQSFFKSLNYIC